MSGNNEEALYCPKCLLRYDQRTHVPKHLPCSHECMLCLGCVKDLYNVNNKYYACTSCSVTCNWPKNLNPVETLRTNNVTLRLLQVSQLHHANNNQIPNQRASVDGSSLGRGVLNPGGRKSSASGQDYRGKLAQDHEAKSRGMSLDSPPLTPPPPPPRRPKPPIPPPSESKLPPKSQPRHSKSLFSASTENLREQQVNRNVYNRDPTVRGSAHKETPKLGRASSSSNVNKDSQEENDNWKDSYVHFLRHDASVERQTPQRQRPNVAEEPDDENDAYLDMNGRQNGPEPLGKIIASEKRKSMSLNSDRRTLGPVNSQNRQTAPSGSLSVGLETSPSDQTGQSQTIGPDPDYLNVDPTIAGSGLHVKANRAPKKVVDPRESAAFQDDKIKFPKRWDRIMCEKHYGDQCDKMCFNCSKAICNQCVTAKHASHMVMPLGESLKKLPEVIKDHLEQFSNAKTDYIQAKKEARESFQMWSKEQKELINQRVSAWINRALRWKGEIESKIESMSVELEENIEGYDDFAQDREQQLQQYVGIFNEGHIIGSKHLEQLTNIRKIKKQLKNLKNTISHQAFRTMTLTQDDTDIELCKFETIENATANPEVQRQDSTDSRSSTVSTLKPKVRFQEYEGDTASTPTPQSPLPSPDIRLMSEVVIGSNEHVYHIDVSPFSEVIAVNANARQITKYVYHNKQFDRKWQKEITPVVSCHADTFKIGTEHNIVIRANGQTILFTPDFEKQVSYVGQYGMLMATLITGHIYAAKMLRTGKYKMKMMSTDHQQSIELAQVTGVPKVACYPPHCAVLDMNEGCLRLFELETTNLEKTGSHRMREAEPVYCGFMRQLEVAEINDIALSAWRLFALVGRNVIHVYNIKEERRITTLTPHDLGLMEDFVVQHIWCSCVGLLHVLYMDWDSYKLRCYQLKGNAIWPK